MKRLTYKYEPTAKIHKYVAILYMGRRAKYIYLANREALRTLKRELKNEPKKFVLEIFKATHDFKEGYSTYVE